MATCWHFPISRSLISETITSSPRCYTFIMIQNSKYSEYWCQEFDRKKKNMYKNDEYIWWDYQTSWYMNSVNLRHWINSNLPRTRATKLRENKCRWHMFILPSLVSSRSVNLRKNYCWSYLLQIYTQLRIPG